MVFIGNMTIENIQLCCWDDLGGNFYGVSWIWSPVQVGKAKGQDEGREGFHI